MLNSSTQSQTSAGPDVCYRCGAPLQGDKTVCPACQRPQLRPCYCGNEIPKREATCPHCGADWSASLYRKRRSTRRKRKALDAKTMASYMVLGALLTALIGVAAYAVVDGLAGYALTSAPEGAIARGGDDTGKLSLAGKGLAMISGRAGAQFGKVFRKLWVVIVAILFGGICGALYYLWRNDVLLPSRSGRRSSRRRRK